MTSSDHRPRSALALGLAMSLMLVSLNDASAHSLRVMTSKGSVATGGKATVYLAWGHDLPVDELISGDRLMTYELSDPRSSAMPFPREVKSLQAQEVVFETDGVYQVVAAMKPIVFTTYTDAAGKRQFALKPKSQVTLENGGKITSSARSHQSAKAWIFSNPKAEPTASTTTTTTTTTTLPKASTTDLEVRIESAAPSQGFPTDKPLKAQVLFRGQPLAQAKLTATHALLGNSDSSAENLVTDAEGRVTLTLPTPGNWVLDVSHEVPAAPGDQAEFDQELYSFAMTIPTVEP